MEEFVYIDGKKYRRGYTTGSCATAASKAAVYTLLTKEKIDTVNIDTPKGIYLSIKVVSSEIGENYALCAVEKDGGDDIDATNGIKVFAKASFEYEDELDKSECDIENLDKKKEEVFSFGNEKFSVFAGNGIGIITKKGLSVNPGRPAINPVPQKMIKREVESVIGGYKNFEKFNIDKLHEKDIEEDKLDIKNNRKKTIKITIFIPEGEEVSKKTFNPRLGIVGGISVIGTSGIVEPMSDDGWKKSLSVELNMKKELGMNNIILVPGNHGESFISEKIGENNFTVRTSNFIGYMLMEAKRMGFKKVLLAGHIGKFIKLSAGIFNTHSKVADARTEILIANLALMGADTKLLKKIDSCLTTEEAVDIINENGFSEVYNIICEKCRKRAELYVDDEIEIGVYIFKMDKTLLGKSKNADEILNSFNG